MEKAAKNTPTLGILCARASEVLYGLSFIFTKHAIGVASPVYLLGWRFAIALAVFGLCIALGIARVDLKGRDIRPLILMGLLFPVLYFVGETVGIMNTTATESGVILACIPAISCIASTVILHKIPSSRQISGILVTLGGVTLTVIAVGLDSSFSVVGYSFLALAVVVYALCSVFAEWAEEYTSSEKTIVMLAVAACVFVAAALVKAVVNGELVELISLPAQDTGFLVAILYQGIGCSVGAVFLSNVAISAVGVNRISALGGLATVVSISAGVLVLREPFSSCRWSARW
ncbi:MAG: DMT family transporter [Atopobiaceae bacterium]|nr:DMT family transporter [Atopobiaceae bacterium]